MCNDSKLYSASFFIINSKLEMVYREYNASGEHTFFILRQSETKAANFFHILIKFIFDDELYQSARRTSGWWCVYINYAPTTINIPNVNLYKLLEQSNFCNKFP